MPVTIKAETVAVLAAAGALGYWLWKKRPIAEIAEALDQLVENIENSYDYNKDGVLTGKDFTDFVDNILSGDLFSKPPGGSLFSGGRPGAHTIWEINLNSGNLRDIFIGPKAFPSAKNYRPPKLPTIASDININHQSWSTHKSRATSAILIPHGYQLRYGSSSSNYLTGDPRALYCLALLIHTAGIPILEHSGMQVPSDRPNAAANDYGHYGGHAIDINTDDDMNAIVRAARTLKMPIGWISRYKVDAGWPKFFLDYGGTKHSAGHSSINHDSHYHVILPRPNAALQAWNLSPYYAPAFTGGGGGGSSEWNAILDPLLNSNPNPDGVPPISDN